MSDEPAPLGPGTRPRAAPLGEETARMRAITRDVFYQPLTITREAAASADTERLERECHALVAEAAAAQGWEAAGTPRLVASRSIYLGQGGRLTVADDPARNPYAPLLYVEQLWGVDVVRGVE